MAKKPRKKQHGGKRPGAGRKVTDPDGPAQKVSLSLPAGLLEKLDERAAASGLTRSQAVAEAVRGFLAG